MGLKLDIILVDKLARLNEIDSVNCGGCAIVAYGLTNYMKKVEPMCEPVIVYLVSRPTEYENLSNNKADSCSHVVVRLNDKYYDSNGIHTTQDIEDRWQPRYKMEINEELVLDSINNVQWNPWFDREDGVPEIAAILELDDSIVNSIKV